MFDERFTMVLSRYPSRPFIFIYFSVFERDRAPSLTKMRTILINSRILPEPRCPISIEITRVTNVSKTRNESLSDGNKTRGIIMAG